MKSKRTKKIISNFIKVGIVGGCLYFLASRGLLSWTATKGAFANWPNLLVAFILVQICNLAGIVRWNMLLRAQGVHLPIKRIAELHFVGQFFNIALPGAISGDFLKAFYVSKEVTHKKGFVFGSLVFDRIMGLSALVFISATTLLFGLHNFEGSKLMDGVEVFLIVGLVGMIAFFSYVMLLKEEHDYVGKFLKTLERRFPALGGLVRIYDGVRIYHHHRTTVLMTFALSVIIQALIATSFLEFAYALGETNLSILGFFVVVPLGLLVTAIPVAPAGVGTGHAAFLALFQLLDSNRGADAFTLSALITIFTGMIGGIVYLRFKSHETSPLPIDPTLET